MVKCLYNFILVLPIVKSAWLWTCCNWKILSRKHKNIRKDRQNSTKYLFNPAFYFPTVHRYTYKMLGTIIASPNLCSVEKYMCILLLLLDIYISVQYKYNSLILYVCVDHLLNESQCSTKTSCDSKFHIWFPYFKFLMILAMRWALGWPSLGWPVTATLKHQVGYLAVYS